MDQNLHVTLVPAPEDPPRSSPEYQEELAAFRRSLEGHHVSVSYGMEIRTSAEGAAIYLGDCTVRLVERLGPALGAALGAWLQARHGRQVRLKIGQFEGEAQTVEQIEGLLHLADEYARKQRNQPVSRFRSKEFRLR